MSDENIQKYKETRRNAKKVDEDVNLDGQIVPMNDTF
jgi:hypothetical protein